MVALDLNTTSFLFPTAQHVPGLLPITLVDDWGPLGYVAYMAVYAGLELLGVSRDPLTMTAGAIFGLLPGTAVVSVASTAACTGAFLVARYVARDKVCSEGCFRVFFECFERACAYAHG